MAGQDFPLSMNTAQKQWDGDNPFSVLHPHEVKAAELYALVDRDPATAATLRPGPKRKWSTMLSTAFEGRFRETFGIELTPRMRRGLEKNPAWAKYVRELQEQSREAVMQLLRSGALEAHADFVDSRKMARKAGDYKELRMAAADHLDRIGATEKPTNQAQMIVVTLKGRNFDEATLMKELPETTVEVVTVAAGDE